MEENEIKNNISSDNLIGESYKMEKNNQKNNAKQPRKQMNTNNSRVSVNDSINKIPGDKFENTVLHLNNVINKEKKKVRDLKALYMREVGSKS